MQAKSVATLTLRSGFYMKTRYLFTFSALKTTSRLYVLTAEKIKQMMEYKMIQKELKLSLSFIQL